MRDLGIAIPAPRAAGSCAVSALVAVTWKSKKKILDGLREIRPETCKPTEPGTKIDVIDSYLIKSGHEIKLFKNPFYFYPTTPNQNPQQLPANARTLEQAIDFVGDKKAIVVFQATVGGVRQAHAVAVGGNQICDNAFAVPSPYRIWKNAVPYRRIGEVISISLIEKEPSDS